MQQQSGADDKGNFQKIGEGLGGLMGQAADTAFGMFGTMMNNMGGWWAANARPQGSGGFSASFDSSQDSECRRHFTAQGGGSGSMKSYEEARPLYELGHLAGQNPDYQGRSFDQVEMDLQRNWGDEQQRRYGEWPRVRGFVQFGYDGRGRSGAGSGSAGGSGFQASASTGSGGFQASGESSREGGGFQAAGGGSTSGGTTGEFRVSGGGEDRGDGSAGGFKVSGEVRRDP